MMNAPSENGDNSDYFNIIMNIMPAFKEKLCFNKALKNRINR